MKEKRIFATLLMIIFVSTMNISQISANFSINIILNDAWYEDADADGDEDDIIILLTLELNNKRVVTKADLYLGIELPSGMEYWFVANFMLRKSGSYGYINLKFTLLNTATESGWYWAHAVGFAAGDQYSMMDSLEFDPPGGKTGGSPTGYWSRY